MKRLFFTVTDEDISVFEGICDKYDVSKSRMFHILLAEHLDRVPSEIENEKLIGSIAELTSALRAYTLSEHLTGEEKLYMEQLSAKLAQSLNKKVSAKLAQSDT